MEGKQARNGIMLLFKPSILDAPIAVRALYPTI